MPLGYETVVVRHLVSGQKLELYAADAVQYLEHPWFSQYYIIDGPIPLSGTAAIISGASGNATKVVNNGLSGTASIVSGASGTVSKRSLVSGTAAIVSGASGNATIAPITATFQASAGSTANASMYTFTTQPIGTPSATRRIVVGISSRAASQSVSSVTVGGVSLAQDVAFNSTNHVAIWSGVVASGMTADIVVTFSLADSSCGIGVWELSGGAPTGNTGTASVTDGNLSMSVTTSSGHVVVAVAAYANTTAAVVSCGWTAATERYDTQIDGRFRNASGADLTASGSSADMSATVTNPDGLGQVACAAAYA